MGFDTKPVTRRFVGLDLLLYKQLFPNGIVAWSSSFMHELGPDRMRFDGVYSLASASAPLGSELPQTGFHILSVCLQISTVVFDL